MHYSIDTNLLRKQINWLEALRPPLTYPDIGLYRIMVRQLRDILEALTSRGTATLKRGQYILIEQQLAWLETLPSPLSSPVVDLHKLHSTLAQGFEVSDTVTLSSIIVEDIPTKTPQVRHSHSYSIADGHHQVGISCKKSMPYASGYPSEIGQAHE